MDILLGQQTGIRPTLALYSNERSSIVVEGYYGALFTRFGSSESAGAGGRWLFTRGGCDSVTFGPGVDVFFNLDRENAIILAPTVDLAWRHGFGERAALKLGINAGFGVGLSGRRDHYRHGSDDVAGQVTPLISFYAGLGY